MTLVHFNLTDSYNKPSRGSLAFMPHRRHAANETEVLPKPVTIPLLNGEATVNLQPNSSTWVWIITEYFEGISKSFYTTIPDRDGVMEHTELVHISPSSLPAPYDAVEPAWWAEMRQYKTTVSDTLLQSGEALTEARAAIDTGRESIERTQHNASVAGAYADESRQSSYDAREYRDEAEQWRNEAQEQADRAATGPESAAARAETAADRAETSETRARTSEDESRASAADARSSETAATGAASTATERASDARNEANRAESEANRSKGYADELMDGPREYVDQAREARDDARDYATDAQNHATNAATSATSADTSAGDAGDYATAASQYVDDAQSIYDEFARQTITGFAQLRAPVGQELPTDTTVTIEFDEATIHGQALVQADASTLEVVHDGWYTVSANMRVNPGAASELNQLYLYHGDSGSHTTNQGSTGISTASSAVYLVQGDTIYCEYRVRTSSVGELSQINGVGLWLRAAYLGPGD